MKCHSHQWTMYQFQAQQIFIFCTKYNSIVLPNADGICIYIFYSFWGKRRKSNDGSRKSCGQWPPEWSFPVYWPICRKTAHFVQFTNFMVGIHIHIRENVVCKGAVLVSDVLPPPHTIYGCFRFWGFDFYPNKPDIALKLTMCYTRQYITVSDV